MIRRPQDITVLIPAAGRVPEGLLALSNISCTAMIPVAGRPVIYWTLKYLRSLGLRNFRIAVPRRGLFVEDFVECTAGRECQCAFIVPPAAGASGGLGQTVSALLEGVKTPSALVVLGDTFFQFSDASVLNAVEPIVFTAPVGESYRWCIAESDHQGRVTRLLDKVKDLAGPLQALMGIYYFNDAAMAKEAAGFAVQDALAAGGRAEMSAVLNRVHAVTPLRAIAVGEWLDCGNPDKQAGSHVALLQKREFNELSIDRTLGTITKRSRLKAKFFDEINYLRLLPADLAVLFPRIVDFSLDWQSLHLKMEYYGYATLAEAFVYENLDPGVWERIFRHLFQILTTAFLKYSQPLGADEMLDMYLRKTQRRMAEMKGSAELEYLKNAREPVWINDRLCPSPAMVWPQVERDVRRLCESGIGCVIHGDLCFSNILYDPRSQICKFVDPRGSFGGAGIVGDLRYDVAKLYHSVLGLYDFITNDLFHVSLDGNRLTLDIRVRQQHQQVLARFESVFFPHFDRREILLITALILASIPALHYDQPRRQIAMYAKSMEILAELYPPHFLGEADAPIDKGRIAAVTESGEI